MSNLVLDVRFTAQQIEMLKGLYPELEEDEDLMSGMITGETDYERVLGKVVDQYLDALSMRAAIKDRQEVLRQRADRFEHRADAMKALAIALMGVAGETTARLPEATLTIRKGGTVVVVDDVDELPQGMFRIERHPAKLAIKDALSAGETVPGAHLETSEPSLSVRTK